MSKRVSTRQMVILLSIVIVLEILVIVLYPMMNTHEEELTIAGIETWGDKLYHVITDGVTLNVTVYYYDDLIAGHTYRIKYVDGLIIDRILVIEEVS